MLFFTGYKKHPKQYKSYLKDFVYNPEEIAKDDVVVTHSVGLVKALNLCHAKGVFPKLIVALDAPDLALLSILDRLPRLEPELQAIYVQFMNLQIDPRDFNITSFRRMTNTTFDCCFYKKNVFYDT